MGDTGSHYGIDNLNVLVRSSNLKLESRSGVAPSCADHGLINQPLVVVLNKQRPGKPFTRIASLEQMGIKKAAQCPHYYSIDQVSSIIATICDTSRAMRCS